jgi:predicted amidohydrolase
MPPSEALHQVDQTIEEFTEMVDKAGAAGCDLIVFPEDTLGLLHWEMGNQDKLAEVLPAAVRQMKKRLGAAARRNQLYLSCCSDTWEPDGTFRNTAFLLDRQGEEIGRYHKVHPAIHESDRKPGIYFPVFETPDLGGVGMLICYDMVMPESARSLALGGADIILVPTLGGAVTAGAPDAVSEDINLAAFRTRAVDNLVYLVVAKRGDGSMVISPQGEILARTQEVDGIAMADIDPSSGREGGDALNSQLDMRARLFRERNPEAYRRLTESRPPVLEKIPATITAKEAARIGAATLTIGGERFQQAENLLEAGQIREGIEALKELRLELPGTWIDRAAAKLLEELEPGGSRGVKD